MLHLAICEDENVFLTYEKDLIANVLAKRDIPCIIDTFASPLDLQQALKKGQSFDILFLDIDMPQMDGISLGIQVKRQLPDSVRIYVSAKTDLVFDSFAAQPFAFIPKDQIDERLEMVLENALREFTVHHQTLILETGHNRVQTDVESLLYAEAMNRKVILHINEECVEATTLLKVYEEQLLPLGFLRIHKAFLVNYRAIFSINKDVVLLKNGQVLPLSKHRAPAIRKEYLLLTSD